MQKRLFSFETLHANNDADISVNVSGNIVLNISKESVIACA